MGKKILVVDDVQDNVDLMAEMLEDAGYDVVEAISGKQALDQAATEHPDVIILDVQMPGMNGFEVCKILKSTEGLKDIPVIFLTAAMLSEQNIVEGLDLGAHDYVTKPFREKELLARISRMVQIKKSEDSMREETYTDPLTGLYNRRYMEKRFGEELALAKRKEYDIACVMIDIDHFKSINDIHGHAAGDYVLKGVADLGKENLREYDTLSRYGGEEFVLLLSQTDYDGAVVVAEKLRKAIESKAFHFEGKDIAVTASFGVYSSDVDELSTAEEFTCKADEALYKAKGSGRNKVVTYRDLYPDE